MLLRAQMPIGRLRALLHQLRAVLFVPEDEDEKQGMPVAIFHKSFPDFLSGKSCSGRNYWINPSVYAVSITYSCVDLLNNSESLEVRNGNQIGIAVDYAHAHFLSLVKAEIFFGNHLLLELIIDYTIVAMVYVHSSRQELKQQ